MHVRQSVLTDQKLSSCPASPSSVSLPPSQVAQPTGATTELQPVSRYVLCFASAREGSLSAVRRDTRLMGQSPTGEEPGSLVGRVRGGTDLVSKVRHRHRIHEAAEARPVAALLLCFRLASCSTSHCPSGPKDSFIAWARRNETTVVAVRTTGGSLRSGLPYALFRCPCLGLS